MEWSKVASPTVCAHTRGTIREKNWQSAASSAKKQPLDQWSVIVYRIAQYTPTRSGNSSWTPVVVFLRKLNSFALCRSIFVLERTYARYLRIQFATVVRKLHERSKSIWGSSLLWSGFTLQSWIRDVELFLSRATLITSETRFHLASALTCAVRGETA
jgi:hypothetical protein